jgi:hypothetical protein
MDAFLRTVFTTLIQDEVGNSHTGRQLSVVWKAFLTEIEQEMYQYQLYRANQNAQQPRGRRTEQLFNPNQAQPLGMPQWSSGSQRIN